MNKLIHDHQPDFHFTVASSNQEIYHQLEKMMRKQGLIGIPDLQGRLHYLVDGRKGVPYALSQINRQTLRLMESRVDDTANRVKQCEQIADHLMERYLFDPSLIGTQFIRLMIVYCLLDSSLLTSLSKRLYPAVADYFSTHGDKVSYSSRYAFKKLFAKERAARQSQKTGLYLMPAERQLNNRQAISRLYKEAGILYKQKKSYRAIAPEKRQDFSD